MKKKNIFSGSNPCEACEICEALVLIVTDLSQLTLNKTDQGLYYIYTLYYVLQYDYVLNLYINRMKNELVE